MFNTKLNNVTQRKYLQMANSFITKQQLSLVDDGLTLCETLTSVSSNYRPDYWRNLRNSISYYLFTENNQELADRVRKLVNPVTSENGVIKSKQKRCKKINEQEVDALIKEAVKRKNKKLSAAIYIAHITGCRPCEMPFINQVNHNTFKIIGGKKRADRGLDRFIKINDPRTAKLIRKLIKELRGEKMKPVQNAFDRLAKKVFWRRKIVPSLYTFRHQMGSDLKASNLNRKTVAYMMGHRVTKSVNVYGNRRTSGGRTIEIAAGVSDTEIDQLVRENHHVVGVVNNHENNEPC